MSSKSQMPHFATVEDVVEELSPGYPVYCLRPAELKRQAHYFLDTFPGRVMYAVKCNPHLAVLKVDNCCSQGFPVKRPNDVHRS